MTTRILRGDCRAILPTLPAASVHCVVTSPPYFGLRSYLPEGHPDKHREIGLERTPDEYVAELVAVFREVRRVLRDDGTLWLNVGDSYASSPPGNRTVGVSAKSGLNGVNGASGRYRETLAAGHQTKRDTSRLDGYKPKDLLGIPWLLAFALRADGWYLRSDIIWYQPIPVPESVRDRPTSAHEHVFLLSKKPSYFYDATAISETGVVPAGTKGAKGSATRAAQPGVNSRPPEYKIYDGTRNARSVWTIATQPYRGPHFAVMPPDLAEKCIKAGTSERGACPHCGAPWARIVKKTRLRNGEQVTGKWEQQTDHRIGASGVGHWRDSTTTKTLGWKASCACAGHPPVPCVVLDPFGGAGTTGLVADRLQRDAVMIELNQDTVDLSGDRVAKEAPLLARVV